jgi:hypothetical protein
MTAPAKPPPEADDEEGALLASLRANHRVIEADREDAPLPPGVTHVLVKKTGSKDRLVERRKSLF